MQISFRLGFAGGLALLAIGTGLMTKADNIGSVICPVIAILGGSLAITYSMD